MMLDIKDQSFACTQLATRTTTRVEGLLPTKQTLGELRELLVVHIRLWGNAMGKNPPCRWSVTCGEGELLSAKIILEIEIVFQQYVANYPSQWVLLHRWVPISEEYKSCSLKNLLYSRVWYSGNYNIM